MIRKTHSIRFKITAITIAVILAIFLSVVTICRSSIQAETDLRSLEIMRLVGRDAQNTLDEYFVNIEQSVGMTANETIDSLDSVILVECGAVGTSAGQSGRTTEQSLRLDAYLEEHCARIQKTFESVASHTHGVVTYYYCINPQVSENVHGFFYSRVGKAGFVAQEPLDARTLDPQDIAHTTWYYTPIQRGRPSWVGPYTAHFLGEMWICSYLVPIYNSGTLIGVLGMDIPLDTLVDKVSPIRIYETGFASLSDSNGQILYHPELPQGSTPELSHLSVPRETIFQPDSGGQLIRYTVGGEQRQMSFSTMRNGMKLVIVAPVQEINASWSRLLRIIQMVSVGAILVYAVVLMLAMGVLTRPLQLLTAAARRLAHADYNVELTYKSKDEVGELTDAFRLMRDQQKSYIDDLNRRLITDDLTGLPNMRHFFQLAAEDRAALLEAGKKPALLYFNLIGMKHFNRQFGFDEGNKLLCAVARILERHYGWQNLCRIGPDQFAAVTDEDGLEAELKAIFEECQSANGGRSLPLRVGIYQDSLDMVDASTACDRAKYACDLRRGTFTSGWSHFKAGMQQKLEKARYVVNHLDQAIAEQWIQVYFQPLVRAVNGKVCDVEALSRWIDPIRGQLSPGDFVPALEDAGLIYKLDLYMLDQVLGMIRQQKEAGYIIVPCSINLSRADFDACDIVEEIRERVDRAGVSRSLITIEITESIIGSNFEYMKEQVERFQNLGFAVWMDDFGSGYSSLDVLQSIKFDLIKFDMSFMRKLDQGEAGKIILTKLMEMATAIGVGTVCEGVETAEQKQFLEEVGCSKLQGYYFCKPVPFEEIMERNRAGMRFGYENPEEAAYYEAVGRVNLYDLGVIASDENSAFRHSFNTLPMGIIEINGNMSRFMRSNQSYRDFMQRFFHVELSQPGQAFGKYNGTPFMENVVQACCEQGTRTFYDETMPDGSTVHSFARRVGVNPVNGNTAVAVAVLSITDPADSTSYAEIARALAADYYNIYVVDLDTEEFMEYTSSVGGNELAMERRGERFFAAVQRDALQRIYQEDQAAFLTTFTREAILRGLAEQGVFTTTYRLIDTGTPMYANMKVLRMPGGNRIIIGVSIIDAQMKQKKAEEHARRDRAALVAEPDGEQPIVGINSADEML